MKWSMLFFALAIGLGILFAVSILWSRCSKEKYIKLPPLPPVIENEDAEEDIPLFYSSPPNVVLHDYLH